jgi:hypothetical protein
MKKGTEFWEAHVASARLEGVPSMLICSDLHSKTLRPTFSGFFDQH